MIFRMGAGTQLLGLGHTASYGRACSNLTLSYTDCPLLTLEIISRFCCSQRTLLPGSLLLRHLIMPAVQGSCDGFSDISIGCVSSVNLDDDQRGSCAVGSLSRGNIALNWGGDDIIVIGVRLVSMAWSAI